MLPPWASAIRRQSARLIPAPRSGPRSRTSTNGSKARSSAPSAGGVPSSRISMVANSSDVTRDPHIDVPRAGRERDAQQMNERQLRLAAIHRDRRQVAGSHLGARTGEDHREFAAGRVEHCAEIDVLDCRRRAGHPAEAEQVIDESLNALDSGSEPRLGRRDRRVPVDRLPTRAWTPRRAAARPPRRAGGRPARRKPRASRPESKARRATVIRRSRQRRPTAAGMPPRPPRDESERRAFAGRS